MEVIVMLINTSSNKMELNVEFISYSGKYPNLCSGELILKINDKEYKWEKPTGFISSGGGLNPNYEGVYSGEWRVDYSQIPDEIKIYAEAIDDCVNHNITYGCCGGCT
jgi:hypothetical protein